MNTVIQITYAVSTAAVENPLHIRWLVIIAGLAVFALAVLVEIIRSRLGSRKQAEEIWRDFEDAAIERGLTGKELTLCKEMARQSLSDRPLRLLTSKEAFDECAGKRMTALRSQGAPGDELESLSDTLGDIRKKLGLTFVPFGRPLSSTRGLRPDQKLTIEVEKGTSATRFLATVLDVTDLGIVMSPPESASGQIKLEPDQKVTVAFWRGDDARYMFITRVHKALYSPHLAIVLEHAEKLQRTQARTFYRVRVSLTATVAELLLKDLAELEKVSDVSSLPTRNQLISTISSISGGGLSLISKSRLNVDDLLRVEIDLGRAYNEIEEPIPEDMTHPPVLLAVCKVVSVSALPALRYLARASFALINETDRDRIVRFVNVKEQKLATLEDQEEEG